METYPTSIRLTDKDYKILDQAIRKGVGKNNSEVIREALRYFEKVLVDYKTLGEEVELLQKENNQMQERLKKIEVVQDQVAESIKVLNHKTGIKHYFN